MAYMGKDSREQEHSILHCGFLSNITKFDQCGSSSDHANQLGSIVAQVMNKTGKNQVNIVAHSKGGLDARVYLEKVILQMLLT